MKLPACHSGERSGVTAFTMLEVMIAMALFFIAIFSILELTARTLNAARGLQRMDVDPGIVASYYFTTNQLDEISEQGDFGDDYPDAKWTSDISLYGTNGLYQVKIDVVQGGEHNAVISEINVIVYKPQSVQGARTRLNLRR